MAKILMSTKNLAKKDWLMARKDGLGGSDAAAALGMSPFSSPLSVYLDKTRDIIDDTDNNYMRLGRDLEDYVAKRFEEQTGKKVRRKNAMMAHDDYDFMIADIDREVVGEKAILECKVSARGRFENWENVLPPQYEIQCLHYLAVTGAEKCYLAALFLMSGEFKIFEIERDDKAIEALIRREKDFWHNHVLAGIEPDYDGSDDADEILKEKYNDPNDEEVLLEDKYLDKLDLYDKLKQEKKDIEKNIKLIEQEIKESMGNAQKAIVGERKVFWKSVTQTRVDTDALKEKYPQVYQECSKESSSRRFTVN